MPGLYDYRIFISHAWKYGTDYDRLIEFLDEANNFSFYDYSAPREKPLFPAGTPYTNLEIASKITAKIRPAQVVLVLSGMYESYSSWMQFEVDEAKRMGKPIIGIYPWGQINVPKHVLDAADEMVRWQTSSIVSAIRRAVP